MAEPDDDPAAPRARKRVLGGELIIPALAGSFALYSLWDIRGLVWEARINGMLIIVRRPP